MKVKLHNKAALKLWKTAKTKNLEKMSILMLTFLKRKVKKNKD